MPPLASVDTQILYKMIWKSTRLCPWDGFLALE